MIGAESSNGLVFNYAVISTPPKSSKLIKLY